jgi:hypothetical protein
MGRVIESHQGIGPRYSLAGFMKMVHFIIWCVIFKLIKINSLLFKEDFFNHLVFSKTHNDNAY